MRRGDPLSPYLFVLAVGCLKHVNGPTFNGSEYLIAQCSEDISLLLDGSEITLNRALYIVDGLSPFISMSRQTDAIGKKNVLKTSWNRV